MVSARANASWQDADGVADHAPTLASAPEGLSARRVERWLDLPTGAWQRRHLYALRLRSESFASLGLRQGDLIVVEPGGREQPGSIVVTRGSSGNSLKKIRQPVSTDRRPSNVLELPLRERPANERVVGTVIGVLRSTGTGALRPVSAGGRRAGSRRTTRDARANVVAIQPRRPVPPVSDDYLHEIQTRWHGWVSAARNGQAIATPAQLERWERLESSLATLCDCLKRTHSPSLRAALAGEASAVVSAIHTEMGG